MPSGWATHIQVEDFTPTYLVQTYLLGVNLGAAYMEPPLLSDGSPNPNAGQLTPAGEGALQAMINGILADVQAKLGIRFAKTRVITDPDEGQILGVDYDIKGERLMYFRVPPTGQHYTIPLPYANVTSIERLRLFYADQHMLDVPLAWISFTSKEGVLRLNPNTPSHGHAMVVGNESRYNSRWFNYGYRDALPHAWSIDYTFGHGQLDDDVARYIGLTAAIQVLAMAGACPENGGGLGSESLSMDGVSENVGYYQGTYGPYSGMVQTYKDQLDCMNIWQMRLTKKGLKIAAW